MARRAAQALGSLDLDEAAVAQDADARGDAEEQRQIMRDEQDGEAARRLQRQQPLEDLPLHDDVERGGRLVEHEQARLERQCQGQRHALTHAARER